MKEWIKEYKTYVFGGMIVLAVMAYYYLLDTPQTSNTLPVTEANMEETSQENPVEQKVVPQQMPPKKIMIDIKGAVVNPGIYEATEGERVHDLIKRAGGLLDYADSTKINFAMYVKDEMILYIPAIGEEVENVTNPVGNSIGQSESGKVNINTANATELETLPGIGPSKSAAIIEYRETNGPFQTIEDIKSISGIGEKTFEKLKEKITID